MQCAHVLKMIYPAVGLQCNKQSYLKWQTYHLPYIIIIAPLLLATNLLLSLCFHLIQYFHHITDEVHMVQIPAEKQHLRAKYQAILCK